jgi:hypothetical protein
MPRILGPQDDEIAWSCHFRFRSDAAKCGHEGAAGKARPIASNGCVEVLSSALVNCISDAVHPLHVGTKASLARQIERDNSRERRQ